MRLQARKGSWKASWLAALAAVLIVAAPAIAAQERHHDSPGIAPNSQDQDQPIQIDAKSLEVHDKTKTATFSGNVKVVQGDTTMTCNTLVVFYGQEIGLGDKTVVAKTNTSTNGATDTQNIRKIEAHGGVTVLSKDQTATGDLGVYDVVTKTITLTGNVVVSQGKNVIHGGRLIVNTVTGNAHVEPDPDAPQGRVRALIIPSKDNKDNNGGGSNFLTIGPGASR
jgi:lipopolysaccharide export system protein LptA